jgi:hypothetical protein
MYGKHFILKSNSKYVFILHIEATKVVSKRDQKVLQKMSHPGRSISY